ncbi:hypothetical protein AGLY_009413 [Aphis glycines]|uniref:Uncharacterized protein n=1 Tax=Aphis glycines TaxID=307491 RepID=A0A6G0THS2_APHGL|nr:hypothetical protein AGLY_009413 [Aphis glycines]
MFHDRDRGIIGLCGVTGILYSVIGRFTIPADTRGDHVRYRMSPWSYAGIPDATEEYEIDTVILKFFVEYKSEIHKFLHVLNMDILCPVTNSVRFFITSLETFLFCGGNRQHICRYLSRWFYFLYYLQYLAFALPTISNMRQVVDYAYNTDILFIFTLTIQNILFHITLIEYWNSN